MLGILKKSLTTGVITMKRGAAQPVPDQACGRIDFMPSRCNGCGRCLAACPTAAIGIYAGNQPGKGIWQIFDGQCLFCGNCLQVCPGSALVNSRECSCASQEKQDLFRSWEINISSRNGLAVLSLSPDYEQRGDELACKIKRVLGRSLHIRHLDVGSCNGCDWELSALLNPVYDIQRFGIDFVASPRHADLLMVTGPVTRNLEEALFKTYSATPEPRLVAACGACACSGGIFREGYAASRGVDKFVAVDLYIPGCPPRPQSIIDGLLALMDRMRK